MAEIALKQDGFDPASAGLGKQPSQHAALRCIVMDDSRFDRKLLQNIAKSGRYEIEFTETSSITEARARLETDKADLVVLDYLVPDGDGIEFAREIVEDKRFAQTAVILMTGLGSEAIAVKALRSGVVDYLPKDELSVELFDRAVENAMKRVDVAKADTTEALTILQEENKTLRRVAVRNMRLLKGQTMAMIAYAGQAVTAAVKRDGEGAGGQQQVAKITRNIVSLIDDTVIVASTHRAVDEPTAIDLNTMIKDILEDEQGEVYASRAHVQVSKLPVIRARHGQINMLFEELLLNAVRAGDIGKVPEIVISSARDPKGNAIIAVEENLVSMSTRKKNAVQGAGDIGQGGGNAQRDPYALSLCQRLAEKNQGELKIVPTSEHTSKIMIRFPRSLWVVDT